MYLKYRFYPQPGCSPEHPGCRPDLAEDCAFVCNAFLPRGPRLPVRAAPTSTQRPEPPPPPPPGRRPGRALCRFRPNAPPGSPHPPFPPPPTLPKLPAFPARPAAGPLTRLLRVIFVGSSLLPPGLPAALMVSLCPRGKLRAVEDGLKAGSSLIVTPGGGLHLPSGDALPHPTPYII